MPTPWNYKQKVQKLPPFLRPLAMGLRTAMMPFNVRFRKGIKIPVESEIEIKIKLTCGVQYACEADVAGDIAEFGTASGRTASVIASAMARFDKFNNGPKKLHLFDSFQGLPEVESAVDGNSVHVKSSIWGKGVCNELSATELKELCKNHLDEERIVIYSGWFKDTLLIIPDGTKFSMVHVDCDYYQSAKEVLDYLFLNKMIQEGTAMFFDDYNCNRASPEFGERRAWSEAIKDYDVNFTDCGEYGWSCRKFIVHSYKV